VTGAAFDAIAPMIQEWYPRHQPNLPGEPIDNGIHGYPYNDQIQLPLSSQVGDGFFNAAQVVVHTEDFLSFFQHFWFMYLSILGVQVQFFY
jgi:hypothetical protein